MHRDFRYSSLSGDFYVRVCVCNVQTVNHSVTYLGHMGQRSGFGLCKLQPGISTEL